MVAPVPQTSTSNVKKVMISSTARDLPDHHKEMLDACLRQGMFPIMMEHLPASDADAIAESLRMVNGVYGAVEQKSGLRENGKRGRRCIFSGSSPPKCERNMAHGSSSGRSGSRSGRC